MPPDDDELLNPLEQRLQADGEAMLRKLAEDVGKPSLLGPDGRPVGEVAPPGEVAEERSHQLERLKRTHEHLHAELEKLTAGDKLMLDCCQLMLVAHKLIMWAKIEMLSNDSMTDLLIDYADAKMRVAVDRTVSNLDLRQLKAQLRDAIGFVDARLQYYGEYIRRRKHRFERATSKRGLKNGCLAVPFATMSRKFSGKDFMLGDLAIFRGSYNAVRHALKMCAHEHMTKNFRSAYYLTSREGETTGDWTECIVPPAWWRGMGVGVEKLDETLKPALDRDLALVIVEDLETLVPPSLYSDSPVVRNRKCLRRLRLWSQENAFAVLVGDKEREDCKPGQLYGQLPFFDVKAVRKDGLAYLQFQDELIQTSEEIFA